MKTAKEFMEFEISNNPNSTSVSIMIEFAKMHVKEALKVSAEAASQAVDDRKNNSGVFNAAINAYPESNIK